MELWTTLKGIAPQPPLVYLPTPDYSYVSYIERYENFFTIFIIEGAVSLIIATTLIIRLLEKLSHNITLTVLLIALLVGSFYSLYDSSQIWSRYQEANQTFLKSISVPYAFYIEDYQSFFIPSVIGGTMSLVIAASLTYVFLSRRKVSRVFLEHSEAKSN